MSLDALSLVTALGLAVAAVALASAGRAGATRALAAMLGANALLVARGLLWGVVGWVSSVPAGVVAMALFALSPALLALAVVRARTGGPLRRSDARAAIPAGLALAGLGTVAAVTGEPPETAAQVVYLIGLNVVALGGMAVAARGVGTLPPRARAAGRAVVAVFAVHWAFSMASWAAALVGVPGGRALEAASLAALLAFGVGSAAWGLRRLPAVLLAAPVPLVPRVDPPEPTSDADPARVRADAALAARVRALLDEERVWLDPELTVEALADRLREAPRDVSRVLNRAIGGGFHGAVGARRVAEAQRLLRDEPGATVLEVIYRVGFNSKSAFHRAFKRHVGMTPTASRRALAEARGDGRAGPAVPVPVPGRPRADAG